MRVSEHARRASWRSCPVAATGSPSRKGKLETSSVKLSETNNNLLEGGKQLYKYFVWGKIKFQNMDSSPKTPCGEFSFANAATHH